MQFRLTACRFDNRRVILAATLSLCFLSSCRRPAPPPENEQETNKNPPPAATTKIERGPIRVDVSFSPNPARLSDEPTLTLRIESEAGIEVQKPPFGSAIGDFLITDFHEPLPRKVDDRSVLEQIYTLEPIRTGELQIAPIVIQFTDSRETGDGKQHEIETEALAVTVAATTDQEIPSLDDLSGLAEPLPIPPTPRSPWGAVLGGLGLLTLCAGGLWLWSRRPEKISVEPELTPQEKAYLELERLVADKLAENDVKQFYVRLTAIVRRYIEGTTGIHAPEQTTEEFLYAIREQRVFSEDEGGRLVAFLESADLVKFAAHEPTAEDLQETFDRAKSFMGMHVAGAAS